MEEIGSVIQVCRICKSSRLEQVVDLGILALTGVFPASDTQATPVSRLAIVLCEECGLTQLSKDFASTELFGADYGYRSSLNASMSAHLGSKAKLLTNYAELGTSDVVVDIGANDGTFIENNVFQESTRVAVDPAIVSLRDYYTPGTFLVPELFTPDRYWEVASKPAKLVTSIAMFYDLPDPVGFATDVASILAPTGVWHLEQSYAPAMLRANAYDTICHEHTEYYTLATLEKIFRSAGLRAVDASLNAVNGGSIAVTVVHEDNPRPESASLQWIRSRESQDVSLIASQWADFQVRVEQHREQVHDLFDFFGKFGASVAGVGASTKGNVLLQYCGLDSSDIQVIGEVNPDKFAHFTPGSKIPIADERDLEFLKPDFLLVLPWHFRPQLETRFQPLLGRGTKLIFPLPNLEIVG